MSTIGRINIHAHIFNLAAVLTPFSEDIVKKRVAYEIDHSDGIPKALRAQLTKILQDLASDLLAGIQDLNEKALLEALLSRISGQETVAALLAQRAGSLPPEVQTLLEGRLERLLLRQMRRVLTWISGRLRRSELPDHREGDLHDFFETLRIAGRSDMADVADWLLSQMDPEDSVVALMMDLTQGDDRDTEAFGRQLVRTSQVARLFPGRILPFVKVNALRTGKLVIDGPDGQPVELEGHFEIMQHALENMGYLGVKLYPTLGHSPDSEAMRKVYAYCEPRGIPLLMHCNKGGFVTSETSSKNANPDLWIPILDRFPKLKICFAHFGGGGGLTGTSLPPAHWGRKILALMSHEGVYCDIAFHRKAMDSDEEAERYKANLSEILEHPTRGGRVLFGTDFWLMRPRLTEANYWRFYENLLGPDRFAQIANENPRRFLGLAPGSRNDALPAYLGLVSGGEEPIRSRPTAWLLEAVEEKVGAEARRRLEEAAADIRPSRGLRIPTWETLLEELTGKRLSDKPSWEAEVSESRTFFGGSPIELSAGARLSARTFDIGSETDPDGILLPSSRPKTSELGPLLAPEPGKSWLKYRLEARLGAEAEFRLTDLGLDFELGAEKTWIFTDYRLHPSSRQAIDAVRADLAAPRFALDRSAVLRLRENEAVSLRQRGTLRGKVSLSLRDVLTGGLEQLSELLGAEATLRLRVDLAASVTVKMQVIDDFKIVFARRGGAYKVALRKQDSNAESVRVEGVAGVQFDDPEALRSTLEQLLAQQLAEPEVTLSSLREKADGTLDSQESQLLERLEARLALQGVKEVRERLDALEEDLRQAIEKLATQRAEVGFSYEYSRLETETTILEATLDEVTLSELHEQLIQGDLYEALDRLREGVPGISLDRYLRLEEVVSRHAWGFNLGGLSRFDVKERRFAIQRSLVGEAVRLSFFGSRSYTDPRNERDVWKVDLRAEMPDFVTESELAIGVENDGDSPPFEFGLAFSMEWLPERLGKTRLRSVLDVASTWGVLPEGSATIDSQIASFETEGLLGKTVRLELQLAIRHEILLPILGRANDGDRLERWANALAAAMPHTARKASSGPAIRRRLYAPLWRDVLERSQEPNFVLRPFELARAARRHLQREGFPAAAEFDNAGQWQTRPSTFGGLLMLDQPIAPWRSFCLGLGALGSAMRDGQTLGTIDRVEHRVASIHQQLESFWTQSHSVRAVGIYLRRCAEAAGVGSGLSASLSASWQGMEGKEEGLVLARI